MWQQAKRLLLNILLLVVSLALAVVLFPIGFIWTCIKSKRVFIYLYVIAYSIDQMGNVVCAYMFNKLIVKAEVFGNPDETISSVMYQNRHRLTTAGKCLYWLIEKIDTGHFEEAFHDKKKTW
jgi:hypothetical protein